MIINVPGFFMYICVVCLYEHMCLCVGGYMYLCRCTYTCVRMVWKPEVTSRCSPQLLFLLYIEVGSPLPEAFCFD